MTTRRRVLVGVGLGLYLVGMGVLAGVALDRMRFDRERAEVLARYDQALREWHMNLMALEKRR